MRVVQTCSTIAADFISQKPHKTGHLNMSWPFFNPFIPQGARFLAGEGSEIIADETTAAKWTTGYTRPLLSFHSDGHGWRAKWNWRPGIRGGKAPRRGLKHSGLPCSKQTKCFFLFKLLTSTSWNLLCQSQGSIETICQNWTLTTSETWGWNQSNKGFRQKKCALTMI